jgi:hypothetical protein
MHAIQIHSDEVEEGKGLKNYGKSHDAYRISLNNVPP